jgi:glutathione S-transferase
MLALEHKGLAYEARLLSFSAREHKTDEFVALNPRGKVPVLVDDGFVVYESVAIMEYLDQKYPDAGSRLYPRDAREASVVRRLVQEIDSYVIPVGTRVFRQIFQKAEERDLAELTDARAALATELGHFDRLAEKGFFAGPLSAADFALYPLVALLRRSEQKEPAYPANLGPNLAAWAKRIESLPFYDKTFPPHWR